MVNAMSTPSTSQITELLRRWSGGGTGVLEELLPIVYKELRRLAAGHMKKERGAHSFQNHGSGARGVLASRGSKGPHPLAGPVSFLWHRSAGDAPGPRRSRSPRRRRLGVEGEAQN